MPFQRTTCPTYGQPRQSRCYFPYRRSLWNPMFGELGSSRFRHSSPLFPKCSHQKFLWGSQIPHRTFSTTRALNFESQTIWLHFEFVPTDWLPMVVQCETSPSLLDLKAQSWAPSKT